MRVRRVLVGVVCTLLVLVGQAEASSAAAAPPAWQCSAEDFNGDPRLGPRVLPTQGSVGVELRTYDRFAGMTPQQFLAAFWDGTTNGWRYPPANGFLIGPDGRPIQVVMFLRAGMRVDRYGSEFGAFLAPTGVLYSQRAIPPQSLDNAADPGSCNYRSYRVVRDFRVDGGPIAPAFGQPGKGLQFLLVAALVPGAPDQLNIKWLLDNGFLQRCVVLGALPFAC